MMTLSKRYYCVEAIDGETECFVNDGFWYTEVRFVFGMHAQLECRRLT